MSKELRIKISLYLGVSFILLLLAISYLQPEPSSFQYMIYRTVLAIAGAGTVAVFPGFIEVRFGKWLKATGVLGFLVVLYFYNPAQLAARNDADKKYPPITAEALKNLSYKIDDEIITINDGKREFNPDSDKGMHEKAIFVYLTDYAFGDLDGDGNIDAIAVLQVTDGGSGIYYYLSPVFNDHGSPKIVGSAYVLGDRLDFRNISIQNCKIDIQLMMHRPEDGLCCPTLFRSLEFAIKDQGLQCKTEPCSEI